jgi:hypothetical protein
MSHQQTLDHPNGDLGGLDGAPESSLLADGAMHLPLRPDSAGGPSAPPAGAGITAAHDPDGRRRLGRGRSRRVPDAPAREGGFVRAVLTAAGLGLALAVVAAAAAYLTFPHAALFRQVHGTVLAGLVPAGALAATIAVVAAWRAARRLLEGRKSAEVLTVVAATVATVVAASGMWAFFAAYVPTIPVWVRIPIFAFLEVAVLSEAFRARDNMRDFGSSGIDGLAMWALTATSAFLASLASTTPAEALFRLAPPLVAAWMWERALVAERRRRPERAHDGDKKITWRMSPQRLLVRLGWADPDGRTVGEAAAQRRITILALAAERCAALDAAGISAGSWRRDRADRRLRSALRQAVEHAGLADDPTLQMSLVRQIKILRAPQDLVTLDVDSPWAVLAGPRREPRDDRRRREERREERRNPGGGDDGDFGRQAAELAKALRQRDAGQVHHLLAGRDDYAELVRWLARNEGPKRLMALAAMYAVPDTITMQSPAKAVAWVAGIVPGKPGEIDKTEIRRLRELVEPVWVALNYPGPAAAAGGENDNQE